jgi:hypothetical protein
VPTEHLIRLRAGWEWYSLDPGSGERWRVALPTIWPPGLVTPFRLVRHFGRPPIDPAREQAVLRLDDVPGLREARLNDRPLGGPVENPRPIEFVLDDLLRTRNELELVVDPRSWSSVESSDRPWGTIALVIRSR